MDQEHAPRLEIRAVGHFRRADALWPGRPVDLPAPARHLVQVMLDHPRRGQRDLCLLMRGRHTQIPSACQRRAALTCPVREMRDGLIRVLAPGQVRARRPRLLARAAPPAFPAPVVALRRAAAWLIIHRRRQG